MSTNPLSLDPVQAMLAQTSLQNTLFDASSRYYGIATQNYVTAAGKQVVYLKRRFLPPSDSFQTLQQHTVTEGERLDNLAATYLGDPTLFWQLCDANNAMRPEGLIETVGRTIRITLPAGITGARL
ncbi:MAG: LysM domain-containing protein [Candidatus Korobacteraceae bacterium]